MKDIYGYLLVSLLWGCTNPFIKYGQSLSKLQANSATKNDNNSNNNSTSTYNSNYKENNYITKVIDFIKQLVNTLTLAICNPNVILPYMINQCGSLVYYLLLSHIPVSQASPICNSMTFVVTAVTGYLLFDEKIRSPVLLVAGSALVVIGVFVCISEENN
eukprot:gene4198-5969_t